MDKQSSVVAKAPGTVPSRRGLYAKLAGHGDRLLNEYLKMLDSRNESIRLGAANKLIDKILPDLKATELSSGENGPLTIKITYENDNGRPTGLADKELPEATNNL